MQNPRMFYKAVVPLWCLVCVVTLWSFTHPYAWGGPHAQSAENGARSAEQPLRVAVLPFHHATADTDAEAIGDGIADSLTTALSNVAGLAVAEQDLVFKTTGRNSEVDFTAKPEDTLQMARLLDVDILVSGSYQRIGGQIRLEARLITVRSGRVLPGNVIHADGPYDGYFMALDKLAASITTALKVPVSPQEKKRVTETVNNTRTLEAYKLYARGRKQMRIGTRSALTAAIDLFHDALNKDPDYALAFAALSDAELRLARLKQDSGEDAVADRQAAVHDAEQSVQKAPRLGAGHRQLSRARAAGGDYDGAAASARQAVAVWPNDAGSYLDLSRALGRGETLSGPELNRALKLMPGIVLIVPEMPRVRVVNKSKYSLQVQFVLDNGQRYVNVLTGPETTRIVGLPPGAFAVTATSALGPKTEHFNFEAGKEYQLTYDAGSWPVALVKVVNKTGVALNLLVGSERHTIPVGQAIVLRLAPGMHGYRATAGPATMSGQKLFQPGEYSWVFSGGSFPRAVITVQNQTSSTLSLVVGNHSLQVGAHGSRELVLYPNTYNYHASIHGLRLAGTKRIEAGQMIWAFQGDDFPAATFIIKNTGDLAVYVHFSGPTNVSVSVGSGGTRSVTVSPGNYTVDATAGSARKTSSYSMDAGHEEKIEYSAHRYIR